ncbi:MAG: 50S ribosomal protein L19 [bacterium]
MAEIIKDIENQEIDSKRVPELRSGDKVVVHTRIHEGKKDRIQRFVGDVIAIKRGLKNIRCNITVRKISNGGFGVEKVFPVHSPMVDRIELLNRGKVRRSKLYYQRKRRGNAAKIKSADII